MGIRAVCFGKRTVWPLLIAGACLLVTIFAAPIAGAAGKTLYASPSGLGEICTEETPCSLRNAVGIAEDGDAVSLAGGTYILPVSGIEIDTAIDVGAAPGSPATLASTSSGDVQVTT